jgi:hypothetical protein
MCQRLFEVKGTTLMNQQDIITTGPHRWKKGETGNAKGRPLGARQRISEKLLTDLAGVWEEHGAGVLQRLAAEEPGKLAQIAFGLLPKEAFLSVAQAAPGGLAPEEWAQLRGVLDAIEAARLGDVAPSEIFAGIETYLRSEFAKPVLAIEHQPAITLPPPPYLRAETSSACVATKALKI